jgi:hypothetical protein
MTGLSWLEPGNLGGWAADIPENGRYDPGRVRGVLPSKLIALTISKG